LVSGVVLQEGPPERAWTRDIMYVDTYVDFSEKNIKNTK
jgi:hypothetical protein